MRPLTALWMLALAMPLSAQDWPEGWEHRTDQHGADASGIAFVTMEPGWHVTTGPSTILYDASNTATGEYSVTSQMHLFDPEGRREAFGIFVGGADLQGPEQAYTYFLIRDGGEYLVKTRHGAETSDVIGWTGHESILSFADREEGGASVANTLSIRVGADQVHFSVNGSEVARVASDDLALEGIVGLRVNHRVNLHVSSLDISDGGGDR